MTHLETLRLHLSNEKSRLSNATHKAEIAMRQIWISQLEKEIAGELKFLGISDDLPELSDDEIFKSLGS